jgi:hypothetical protein
MDIHLYPVLDFYPAAGSAVFRLWKAGKRCKRRRENISRQPDFFFEPAAFLSVYIAVYGFYQLHAV